MTIIITVILAIVIISIVVFIVKRLNLYITQLEKKVAEQITLTQNLKQSLNEIIAEGYLQNDGRLKKFAYQKEGRNVIVNGRSSDETVEI